MGKRKRKLTAAEKAEKKRRRELYDFVFVGGKMKRVRKPPTIDGMSVEEFIRRNADPIFLHQEGLWWMMEDEESSEPREPRPVDHPIKPVSDDEDDLPF